MKSILYLLLSSLLYNNVNSATVEYTLVIAHEDFDTTDPISGEQNSRLATLVNGTLPGPTLKANLGDEVVVKVINEMATSGVSIHFHGQHQVGTYYMDGVPQVTQCVISASHSFEYRFIAEPAGTFMYHSHMPYQIGDGVYGAFIVDDPEDPYNDEVADEVILGVSDWLRYYSDRTYQYTSQFRFDSWPLAYYLGFFNGKGLSDPFKYTVTAGETYRLRVYCISTEYGFRLYLAGHKLKVIAADGVLVTPQDVDFVDVWSGERYDFLLDANQAPGSYELRARAINFQGKLTDSYTSAVFTYKGAKTNKKIYSAEAVMNNDYDQNLYKLLYPAGLAPYVNGHYKKLPGPKELLSGEYLHTYESTSFMIEGERQFAFMDSWNNHMYQKPTLPFLFAAERDALDDAVSDTRTAKTIAYSDSNVHGKAVIGPKYENLKEGSIVDILFQNAPTSGNEYSDFSAVHANHLHGQYYWVLGSGDGAFDLEDPNYIKKLNFENPSQRDNYAIRPNGWAVFRVKLSNPGIWLLHCHSETHIRFGMATVWVVGDVDKLPKIPDNFPRCGAFASGPEKPKKPHSPKKPKKKIYYALTVNENSSVASLPSFLSLPVTLAVIASISYVLL